jgi:TPR repeat protein
MAKQTDPVGRNIIITGLSILGIIIAMVAVSEYTNHQKEKYSSPYVRGAELGDAEAQNNLGNMYYVGQGVEQDYAEALRLYELAAEQGYASAQTKLGYMYSEGLGVEQDYAEALRLYKLAAEQGNATAQNNLAVMYVDGNGVEQDLEKAKMWYEVAVKNGDETAKSNLSNLLQRPDMKRKVALGRGNVFTENPSITPVFVRDGTRYWRCSDTIHKLVQKELFSAVRTVANEKNMPLPLSPLCTYSRYELDMFGSKSQKYVVGWYVSEASQRSCMRDTCHHFRSAHFKYIDGKLHADIFLTRVATQQVRYACYNVEDKHFRYRNKGCMH